MFVKKFSLLLLSLGLVAVFAGCSSNSQAQDGSTKAADASTTAAATTTAADSSPVKMGRVEYAAHGTKCFTIAVVAMQGDKIVSASLDDYQFMSTDVAKGVPNSDKDFGQNYKDPKMVLASKKANAEYYSEHMKEEAGASTPVDESLVAIEQYVTGKTVAELEDELSSKSAEQWVDAVSGATLVDTQGYVKALVEAAKSVK